MLFKIFVLIGLYIGSLKASDYNPDHCGIGGVADDIITDRIMGGQNAKMGDYPFVVPIFNNQRYICTGTLISPRHVVTAAHCFAEIGTETWISQICNGNEGCIRQTMGLKYQERCKTGFKDASSIIADTTIGYGSVLLNSTDMKHLSIEAIEPSYIRFYKSGCYEHDLALLTIAGPVEDRAYACLGYATGINVRDDNFEGVVLGWGKNPITQTEIYQNLQVLNVEKPVDYADCKDSWINFPVDCICLNESLSANPCEGDSGGPLIVKYKGKYTLLGVLSFGTNCDKLRENESVKSSAYTRLDFHQAKINALIGWDNDNWEMSRDG